MTELAVQRSVVGTIELAYNAEKESSCICCPGPHVYGMGLNINEDYPGRWPYHKPPYRAGDYVHDMVRQVWRELGYDAHGRQVRITVELLPGG